MPSNGIGTNVGGMCNPWRIAKLGVQTIWLDKLKISTHIGSDDIQGRLVYENFPNARHKVRKVLMPQNLSMLDIYKIVSSGV